VKPDGAHSCAALPVQMKFVFAVIEQFCGMLTSTTWLQLIWQPKVVSSFEPEYVTVYVPGRLVVMHFVVAPVFQRYVFHPSGAHKVVDCPAQSGPL
jgi:hypothetical protein